MNFLAQSRSFRREVAFFTGGCLAFLLSGSARAQETPSPPSLKPADFTRVEAPSAHASGGSDLYEEGGLIVVKPAGKEPTLAIGGLLQGQAEFGDKGDTRFTTGNDRFYLRRARLNATGRFLEELDFRLEFDFGGSLAEGSGQRAQMTDGYITWNRYAFFGARVGQFKTPFGYEQLYSDPRLFTMERTLANDRLTLGRQIGVQVFGDLLDKRLSYAAGVFNGNGVNTSANDDDRFLVVARVAGILWQGKWLGQEGKWTLGVDSYASGDATLSSQPVEFGFDSVPGGTADNIFSGNRSGVGADAQVNLGRFDLWLEYLRARFEPQDSLPFDQFDSAGWYAQGSCFVVPKKLQVVLKFDTFDPSLRIQENSTHTWTGGVNYLIKADDLKLQLDYLRGEAPGFSGDQGKLLLRLQAIF